MLEETTPATHEIATRPLERRVVESTTLPHSHPSDGECLPNPHPNDKDRSYCHHPTTRTHPAPAPASACASASASTSTPPHPTSPHPTSPHPTSPHPTSSHLTSPHLTSPHLTSPHLTSPHLTSPHLTSLHLTPTPAPAPAPAPTSIYTTIPLYPTPPHFTPPHPTPPHLNPPHPTQAHLTSPHITSPHLTSPQSNPFPHLHQPFPRTPSHVSVESGCGSALLGAKGAKENFYKAPKLIYTVILWHSFVMQYTPSPMEGNRHFMTAPPPPWGVAREHSRNDHC